MNQGYYKQVNKIKGIGIILVSVLILILTGEAMAESEKMLELNSVMMQNTYKLEGKKSLGTCFLIGKPTKEDPKFAKFVLVTAAHILEQMEGDEATMYLRRRQEDGSLIKSAWKIKIREDENILWVKNKQGLDVAAMYVTLPKDTDYELLTTSMFANNKVLEDYEIHPGDEMYCLGFPFGAESNTLGFPILRSGKIASFPIIPTDKNDSFLLDFEVFRGNSGGPVYFVESNRIYKGRAHIGKVQFLAGLVSKEFNITETVKSLYETKQQTHPLALAVIIHASHIIDTIDQLPEKQE